MIRGLSRVIIARRARGAMRRAAAAAALATLAAASFAACGGDDNGVESAPAETATVSVQDVPGYGEVLVTSSGDPVYVTSADPEGESACTGECARTWRPLTIEGRPTAGPDVDAGLLSTIRRGDGETQALYNDRPLYQHRGEGLPAGTEAYGGTWYLVDRDGEPVEGTAAGGY